MLAVSSASIALSCWVVDAVAVLLLRWVLLLGPLVASSCADAGRRIVDGLRSSVIVVRDIDLLSKQVTSNVRHILSATQRGIARDTWAHEK